MKRNKITSLLLATTLVLQPIAITLVLQPTVAFAEEQTIDSKAKQTNLTYTGCTYEFNRKSDVKDICSTMTNSLYTYWVDSDNNVYKISPESFFNDTYVYHKGIVQDICAAGAFLYVKYQDGYVDKVSYNTIGDKGLIDSIVGVDTFKLQDGSYALDKDLAKLNFTEGQIVKVTTECGDGFYTYILNTKGELYLGTGPFEKIADNVKDISGMNAMFSKSKCIVLMNDGSLKYSTKGKLDSLGSDKYTNSKLVDNILYSDEGVFVIDAYYKKMYKLEGGDYNLNLEDNITGCGWGACVIRKDGTILVQDFNHFRYYTKDFSLKGDYSKLKEIEDSVYVNFQSDKLKKRIALYAQCKEQEKELNSATLETLKSDINALEESDAKTELIKNVEQLEIINVLKSDIEKAIKSKDDVVINKGVESLNAVEDWGNCEAQRVELTKQLSDKLTDKAEISRLNGDVTRARKCVVNLPSTEASLKNGYLNRLNQIQLLNMDTQIIESVQALANSINETLANKNYTKQSLTTLKEEAESTQATFDNIIEPSVRSRAVSFLAMPYNNLCKTIDEMPDLSTEDSVNDEIIKADKDINKLINIYVTINGLPDDNANKSKYEELIKKAISDLFKDSSSVDDIVNKIKEYMSKGELTKDQVDSIVNGIEDETLINQIKDKLSSTSKPNDNNSKVTEATEAVIKAEKSKNQSDIDDALTKVNSLPDGLDKDKLMDRINNITNPKPTDPDDTNTPQTVSKDLVVKTNTSNSLELILDTNEITFGDYNGAKDSEKANAVTATVSSSLPFDLNVSQLNEIRSSTGNKMADELLELRKVGTQYTSLGKGNKKVFESNHESGKDIRVPFDIRLKGDSSVKKDNYQTTLRFEAMQK